MRASISRWFPNNCDMLYRHFTELEEFATWSKLPDDITYELIKSKNGEINGLITTSYMCGGWWKSTFETIYTEKNRETRTILTGLSDPNANEVLGTDKCLMREMATRTQYLDAKEGSEIKIEFYLKPHKFSYWLDSYLHLRDWRRRTSILLVLLDEYLNNSSRESKTK